MRLRNVKNKEQIMDNSPYLITNPQEYCGKWHTLFGNDNPIHLEIGMGKGQFLIENARLYPEINFIGVEKFDSVVARALQKVPEGLSNIKMIRGNALEIETMFQQEVALLYLNFSDPWPKKRQAFRRLTSPIFLKKYDSIFCSHPTIIQKTDNQNLFEYSLVSLSCYGYSLVEVSLDLHHSEVTDNIETEFEEKFSQEGFPIYRVMAVKNLDEISKNV